VFTGTSSRKSVSLLLLFSSLPSTCSPDRPTTTTTTAEEEEEDARSLGRPWQSAEMEEDGGRSTDRTLQARAHN